MRLENKRGVITGGAGGIGQATAVRFSQEGAEVVIADVDQEVGRAAAAAIGAQGGRAKFIPVDVTRPGEVKQLVAAAADHLGGIDFWMNNAGASLTEDLLDIDEADWTADLTLNLTGHFQCTQAVLPVMIEGGGGSVINTSSVNGLWAIGELGYSAAKAGLISFTKNVAVKYGAQGIRANVICPGTIDTPRGGSYWDEKAGAKEKLVKWYPAGRLGKPEDIAALAVYLASDESSFMTGATLVIDGGLTAGTTLFGNV